MDHLNDSNISFPLRNIFQKSKNIALRVANVTNIKIENNTVETFNGNFIYDYLF
jgi:NADH dehydrogenase